MRNIVALCVTIVVVEKQQRIVCVCVVVELHVIVNYVKIPSVAQQCVCGKLTSPATVKCT